MQTEPKLTPHLLTNRMLRAGYLDDRLACLQNPQPEQVAYRRP